MAITRRSVAGAATILSGAIVAACGAPSGQGALPSGGTAKEPVTIQFAHWGTPDYYDRNRQRPSVMKAAAEEFTLYKAEQARHKAA